MSKTEIQSMLNFKSINLDSVKSEMNSSLKPSLDKLSKLKYGSKEWFDERDNYFKIQDSYGKKYTSAFLKDHGINLKTKDLNQFSKWMGIGEGYCNSNSDYRSIVDPVTGDRDYELTDPRKKK